MPETQILRKPPQLPWTDAASIPEAFITGTSPNSLISFFCADYARAAFQALVLVGEIKRGNDVLIHTGASGVGLAAIQLARFYGA